MRCAIRSAICRSSRFHELVGAHVEDPEEVVIDTESDRVLFVRALVAEAISEWDMATSTCTRDFFLMQRPQPVWTTR